MILDCPKCHAKYNIADSAIPAVGRNVRCASCGHYWFQKSPTSMVLRPEINPSGGASGGVGGNNDNPRMTFDSEGSKATATSPRFGNAAKKPHEIVREKAFSKAKFLYYFAIFAAWFGAFAILVGGVLFSVANREAIVKKWANSASFFSMLGARANTYGLEIAKVQVRAGQDAQGQRLVVAGVIKSTSYVAKPVPYLRITLIDDKNKKVASWLADPGITVITPMAEQAFESVRRPMPQGNLRVIVTFNDPPHDLPNGQAIASTKKDTLMGKEGNSPIAAPAPNPATINPAPHEVAANPAHASEAALSGGENAKSTNATNAPQHDNHDTKNPNLNTAVGR